MAELTKCLGSAYATFAEKSTSDIPSHDKMLSDVWTTFMHTNALNPMMYPSLRKFETEIIRYIITIHIPPAIEKIVDTLFYANITY